MAVKTEKELGNAINNEQDTIEIEGDLVNKVLRIKATGKVVWAVAAGAIGVAVVAILYPVPEPTTQLASKGVAATASGAAVAILGTGTTATAILIAISAGGIGVLNKLRTYKVVSTAKNRIVLKKS